MASEITTYTKALRRAAARVPGAGMLSRKSLEDTIAGRTVMITGASSGIGEATALQVGDAGATVLLVSRSADKLETLARRIAEGGGTAHVHTCDLADLEDIDRMATQALAAHGHVDVLVNNAGRSIRRSVALSYDRIHDYQRTMQLNYFGAVKLILSLLPTMRERKGGTIVNVSSIGVQTNPPRFSAYVASKAALDAFSRCVASEIVDDGVRISTVHMPLVRTPMIEPTGMYDFFPAISPEDAADMICTAIVRRPKRVATGLGNLGQLTYALAPDVQDAFLNTAYKLFPDSAAARGESDSPPAGGQRGSARQVAFARLTRGVHW
jgi:NAD(P)-dependent dehydrogenase (short-subunit alcohol dehydrogenase family)